jgi:hypothetical protein
MANGASTPGLRPALALARLAQHHGIGQRDMLERLITAADERTTRPTPNTTAFVQQAFCGGFAPHKPLNSFRTNP